MVTPQRALFSETDLRPLWLGAIILLALLSVWAAAATYLRKRHERQAVAAIEASHGDVWYSYQWSDESPEPDGAAHPPVPGWIRRIFGDDFFGHPTHVFSFPTTPDDVVRAIRELPTLTGVTLCTSESTSEPFAGVSALPHLRSLEIYGPIDFHDLRYAPSIPTLRVLWLWQTEVSDAACKLIVEKFPALCDLRIEGEDQRSEPSEAGLAAIRQLPNIETFCLTNSGSVPNTGLGIFSGSPTLRVLCAGGARGR